MSKHKQIRTKISDFMGSYRGKTLFNIFYGLGASLVVIGLMFKLLHYGGANIMLGIGLSTEALIFALSAFEPPYRTYRWDQVFPVLRTNDENDRPDFSGKGTGSAGINTNNVAGMSPGGQPTGGDKYIPEQQVPPNIIYGGNVNPVSGITPDQARMNYGISPQVPLTEEETQTLSDSIKRMGEAVRQLNNLADVSLVTEKYLSQLSGMADNLKKFSDATGSLAEVSNVLLSSYKNITENSDDISNNSKGYVEQMGNLNRNLMGLNTIYEIQLKSISSQIDTIDHVNKGLVHIKNMYEGSMGDSDRFNKETENLAENLTMLNSVYTRMLEAMTPNVVFGGFNPGKKPETPKEP
jgi:gliding motility-associated protein GldL